MDIKKWVGDRVIVTMSVDEARDLISDLAFGVTMRGSEFENLRNGLVKAVYGEADG